MFIMTVDDVNFNRKQKAANQDQYMQFMIIRGDLIDLSDEYKIRGGAVNMNETFRKKTTYYYKKDVVQEKWATIAIRVRNGPPQPNAKDQGFVNICT